MEQMRLDFEAPSRVSDAPAQEGDRVEGATNEPRILSVSEVNRAVKDTLESDFRLIWLKGEISNFKAHTSGHFYFSLKDAKAQISAVMFRGFNARLKFRPADGMEVIVRGKITVYEPRGNYQIFCELMEPVGAGALQLAFEKLRTKLAKEGLFATERKRPLPKLPRHVAVVTSPTGAAIRDILNVLGRRFKGLRVTVVPALVQGAGAPASIVAGIELAQRLSDVDVMIVGRGGGSLEDLWGFNDETVARAIFNCRIPVISAVGHEVDTTIADYVADLRAPTPSAAAELVVQNASELSDRIHLQSKRLRQAWQNSIRLHRTHLLGVSRRLIDPKRRLQDLSMRCDELTQRLESGVLRYFERRAQDVRLLITKLISPTETLRRHRQAVQSLMSALNQSVKMRLESERENLSKWTSLLDAVSPLRVLERGYSITRSKGRLLKDAGSVQKGDRIEVTLHEGRIEAEVIQ